MLYIYLHCVLLFYAGYAFTVVVNSENAPLCESDWMPIGNSCYLMPNKSEDTEYDHDEGEVFCKTHSARLPVFKDNQDYKLFYEKVKYLNKTWLGYKSMLKNDSDPPNMILTYVSNSSGTICQIGTQVLGKQHPFASPEKLCIVSSQRDKFPEKNELWETMWENMNCDEKYVVICQKPHYGNDCVNISSSTVRVADVSATAGATNGTKTVVSTDPKKEMFSTTDSTVTASTAKMRTIESIEKRFENNIPLICVISLLLITLVVALIVVKRKAKKSKSDEPATPNEQVNKTGSNVPVNPTTKYKVSNDISSNSSSFHNKIATKQHVKNIYIARVQKVVVGKKKRKNKERNSGLHELFRVAAKS